MLIPHEKCLCPLRVAQITSLLLFMQYRFYVDSKSSITSCILPDPDTFTCDMFKLSSLNATQGPDSAVLRARSVSTCASSGGTRKPPRNTCPVLSIVKCYQMQKHRTRSNCGHALQTFFLRKIRMTNFISHAEEICNAITGVRYLFCNS